MYIVKAEEKQVEKIVDMSIRAFETDVNVGGTKDDCPPEYDSVRMEKIIRTERLFLREMNNDDFDALYRVLADKTIMRHYPYTFDEARVHKWIETNIERYRVFGFGLLAVCLKDTGELIGDCGLTMQNIGGFIRPEIGYHIRADQQHCGYAKEAAYAVRDWVFSHTTFRIVYSYMRTENIPSAKTAESIGMSLAYKYTDDDGAEISVYAIETMKNEQIQ